MRPGGRFLRFALIGGVAFFIDAGLLLLLLAAGLGPYLGRAISLVTAATFTWQGNRRYTFDAPQRDGSGLFGEWAIYLVAMLFGGGVNYGVYALLIGFSPLFATWPVLAVAVSTGVSMLVNFASARWILQREN